MTIECARDGRQVLVTWDGERWTASDIDSGELLDTGRASGTQQLNDDITRHGYDLAPHAERN